MHHACGVRDRTRTLCSAAVGVYSLLALIGCGGGGSAPSTAASNPPPPSSEPPPQSHPPQSHPRRSRLTEPQSRPEPRQIKASITALRGNGHDRCYELFWRCDTCGEWGDPHLHRWSVHDDGTIQLASPEGSIDFVSPATTPSGNTVSGGVSVTKGDAAHFGRRALGGVAEVPPHR